MSYMEEHAYIHTCDLAIGYKRPLLSGLCLHARRGEMVCLIGKNGCGKSTLLNTITGLLPALSGTVIIGSRPIGNIPLRQRSTMVSYVPSKMEIPANLTVYELAAMGRTPYTNIFDRRSSTDEQIIMRNLTAAGLQPLCDKPLWAISDGERQKAMICRALVQETPAIIFDEPTAFLDFTAKQTLLKTLSEIVMQQQKCIIFSCHDLDIALKYATTVWYFSGGSIGEFSIDDFFAQGIDKTLYIK